MKKHRINNMFVVLYERANVHLSLNMSRLSESRVEIVLKKSCGQKIKKRGSTIILSVDVGFVEKKKRKEIVYLKDTCKRRRTTRSRGKRMYKGKSTYTHTHTDHICTSFF